MGDVWHGQLAAEHFEPRARLVFGYQPRTQKYRKRKRWLASIGRAEDGGETDLVLTGTSRRLVHNATIRATANRTTVTHFMPVYFGRPPKPSSPVLRDEMTRLSPRQEKILSESGAQTYRQYLRQMRASKVTKT